MPEPTWGLASRGRGVFRAHLGDTDRKRRDPVIGDVVNMFMMGPPMFELSNCSALSCAFAVLDKSQPRWHLFGAPRNGEGGMLRKSAMAAAVAMLFALPALAQNPPGAPQVRVRRPIEELEGANLIDKSQARTEATVGVTAET